MTKRSSGSKKKPLWISLKSLERLDPDMLGLLEMFAAKKNIDVVVLLEEAINDLLKKYKAP